MHFSSVYTLILIEQNYLEIIETRKKNGLWWGLRGCCPTNGESFKHRVLTIVLHVSCFIQFYRRRQNNYGALYRNFKKYRSATYDFPTAEDTGLFSYLYWMLLTAFSHYKSLLKSIEGSRLWTRVVFMWIYKRIAVRLGFCCKWSFKRYIAEISSTHLLFVKSKAQKYEGFNEPIHRGWVRVKKKSWSASAISNFRS